MNADRKVGNMSLLIGVLCCCFPKTWRTHRRRSTRTVYAFTSVFSFCRLCLRSDYIGLCSMPRPWKLRRAFCAAVPANTASPLLRSADTFAYSLSRSLRFCSMVSGAANTDHWARKWQRNVDFFSRHGYNWREDPDELGIESMKEAIERPSSVVGQKASPKTTPESIRAPPVLSAPKRRKRR